VAAHEAPSRVNFGAMGAWTARQDIAAAMCWLDPAAFAKRLNAEIDAMPQNEFSLSHRERMQRLRLAEQDLFELERSEELLILKVRKSLREGSTPLPPRSWESLSASERPRTPPHKFSFSQPGCSLGSSSRPSGCRGPCRGRSQPAVTLGCYPSPGWRGRQLAISWRYAPSCR
jgi:hypothetical protein